MVHREETLGWFLYKRRDSTSTICLPDFLKIKTNKKLVADIILVNLVIGHAPNKKCTQFQKVETFQYNTKLPAWASWPFPIYLFFIYGMVRRKMNGANIVLIYLRRVISGLFSQRYFLSLLVGYISPIFLVFQTFKSNISRCDHQRTEVKKSNCTD